MKKIGFDIGNVVSKVNMYSLRYFDSRYLEIPLREGAVETLIEVVKKYSPKNVFLISKCSPLFMRRTNEWLTAKMFFEITGIFEGNLLYCAHVADKAQIARTFGLSAFVDNDENVLKHMKGIVDTLYLFHPKIDDEVGNRFVDLHANYIVCPDWNTLAQRIL